MNRNDLGRACALAALALSLGACAQPDADSAAAGGTVARIERGTFVQELLLTGELQAVRSVAIKAPETAIFQMRIEFMAEEGSTVKADEPLLAFDNSGIASNVLDLEARILDAETRIVAKRNEGESALKDLEIELAQKRHDEALAGIEASVDEGVLPRKVHAERKLAHERTVQQLRETEARVTSTRERAQADLDVLIIERDKLVKDLESSRQGLDLLAIEAPAEGLVVYERRDGTGARYQEGDSCWPGQTVMRLPDLSEMKAVFHVNEVDAPLLSEGMPVVVRLDSFPGRELDGEIVHVPSMAVKRGGGSKIAVFEISAQLSETWPGEMKPGMSVQGRVVIDRREDVPMVTRSVVRFDGETYWMQQPAAGDGEPREVAIRPVARNATHYVLAEDGLPEEVASLGLGAST